MFPKRFLEENLSSSPGGNCQIVNSNRCCESTGVWKQQQTVQCQCKNGYSAGTTRMKPTCVRGEKVFHIAQRFTNRVACHSKMDDEVVVPFPAVQHLKLPAYSSVFIYC